MSLKGNHSDHFVNVTEISDQSVMEKKHPKYKLLNLCDLKHAVLNYSMLGRPQEQSEDVQDAGNATETDFCPFIPTFHSLFRSNPIGFGLKATQCFHGEKCAVLLLPFSPLRSKRSDLQRQTCSCSSRLFFLFNRIPQWNVFHYDNISTACN